ncbi:hypothetical protein IT411_03655 [Candidatus Peregrinibacteria bacterium]|nr:hypothetical protein [Candidatus Peregrinibacteria bacterium]
MANCNQDIPETPVETTENSVSKMNISISEAELLVIDDENCILNTYQRVFRRLFNRVIATQYTDQALEIITNDLKPQSIILSDHLAFGSMTGAELSVKSKPVRIAKQIPFLLITGSHYHRDDDFNGRAYQFKTPGELIQAGMIDGLFEKPFIYTEMKQTFLDYYK